jgi:predicted GNAT superfamily acetyltransferase
MFYYLMLAFLIFIGLFAHIILAAMAHSLLKDTNVTYNSKNFEWYKPKYKKYLLIPGVAEVVLGLIILTVLCAVMYTFIIYFFED